MKTMIALVLLSTPVMADETWVTANGPAVYEADIGPTGILSVPMGRVGRICILMGWAAIRKNAS